MSLNLHYLCSKNLKIGDTSEHILMEKRRDVSFF